MNTNADSGETGFAAGPPQGKMRPLGGQRSTRSGQRGGHQTRRARVAARPV